jgi:hypothetical protein
VSVDVSKLSLRAQYKYSKDDRWTWIEESIQIPQNVISHSSRKVPIGFKMNFVPVAAATNDDVEMETESVAAAGGAAAAAIVAVNTPSKRKTSQSSAAKNASPKKAI